MCPGILVGGGDHQLDAVQLVHLRGAWIVVDGNHIGHRVLAAQFGKHAPANHMVRQAGERLGTTEAELAALMLTGQEKLTAEQPEPDFDPDTSSQPLTAGNDSRRNESAVTD